MKKIKASSFKKDTYYESVKNAVDTILKTANVVTPVDVFIHSKNLTKKNYEMWRHGKIPYLEKVIMGNLSVINRKLRILKYYCIERGLKQSKTVYMTWGKGTKRLLRFSKSGYPGMEERYSTHYVTHASSPGTGDERLIASTDPWEIDE